MKKQRDVASETNKVQTGSSKAASSHLALMYNLISPHFIKRLALRLTVGAQKYGSVQWRQGINDAEYVRDRFNHFIDHLMKLMDEGNEYDDNLGAMIWGLHCLSEVERLSPESFKKHITGLCNLYGLSAEAFHLQEMTQKQNNSKGRQ